MRKADAESACFLENWERLVLDVVEKTPKV